MSLKEAILPTNLGGKKKGHKMKDLKLSTAAQTWDILSYTMTSNNYLNTLRISENKVE